MQLIWEDSLHFEACILMRSASFEMEVQELMSKEIHVFLLTTNGCVLYFARGDYRGTLRYFNMKGKKQNGINSHPNFICLLLLFPPQNRCLPKPSSIQCCRS